MVGDDDVNLEAVRQLAAGLAPNLKEVIAVSFYPRHSSRLHRELDSWKGLPGFTNGSVGSLTSLSLKGFSSLGSLLLLQNWAKYTDSTCLRHLALGGSYMDKSSALSCDTMEWIAQNHSFPQLRSLSVYLARDD